MSWYCPLLGLFVSVMVLSVSKCFGLSRCYPSLGDLTCHGVVLFSASLSVMVLSASRGCFSVAVLSVSNCFGLSRRCPFLGILVCHGVVASRHFSLSRCCLFLF